MHKLALALGALCWLLACRGSSPSPGETPADSPSQNAAAAMPLFSAPSGAAHGPSAKPLFPACGTLDQAIHHGTLSTAASQDTPQRHAVTASRQVHRLSVAARSGDLLHLVVQQQDVDIVLSLLDARGQPVLRVDSLYGDRGDEEVFWISPQDGPLDLLICAPRELPRKGSFGAYIRKQAPPDGKERRIAEAFLLYHSAEAKRRQGTKASRLEAIDLYEQAAARWQELGRGHEAALCTYGLSRIYTDQRDDMEKAARYVVRAIEELQAADDTFLVGSSRHRLGFIHEYQGDRREAVVQYKKALVIRRRIGHQAGELRTATNLAGAFMVLGELSQARDLYEEALTLAHKLNLKHQVGNLALALGSYYRDLNDHERALDRLSQALKIRLELGDTEGIAATHHLIAQTYTNLLRYDKTLEHANLAFSLYESLGLRRQKARALKSIGFAKMELGEPDVALDHYNQSLQISKELKDLRQQAHTYQSIGFVLGETGRCDDALGEFSKAAAIYDKLQDTKESALAHENMAICLQWIGELERAIDFAKQAIELAEFSRSRTISMSWRAKYFENMRFYYDFLADLLMESTAKGGPLSRSGEALKVSEQAKARSLLDAISSKKERYQPNASRELMDEVDLLREKISYGEASRLLGTARERNANSAEMSEDPHLLLEKYEILSRRLGLHGQTGNKTEILGLDEIRQVLGSDTTLLQFHIGYRESHLWLVDQQKILHFSLPSSEAIEPIAAATYRNLRTKARPVQTRLLMQELSNTLFKGVFEEVETERVLVVSDGPLHYIPLDSLPLPGESSNSGSAASQGYIGERFDLIGAPSVSVLAKIREIRDQRERPSRDQRIAILADPIFHPNDPRLVSNLQASESLGNGKLDTAVEASGQRIAGLERLVYSRGEAESIAEIALQTGWEATLVLGPDATKEIFSKQELPQLEVLHFATHADFNSRQPEFAHLLLSRFDSQGEPLDGFLFAYELYGLDLKVDTVVLSTCSSALGSDIRGEGLVGLTHGFLQAGATRVLVSLWQVDDRATAVLMRNFYQNLLGEGMEPARSLWMAKESTRSNPEWKEPYYWAGFSLVGDWKQGS